MDDVLLNLWLCDPFLIYFKVDPAKIGGILALVNIASTILQPFISQVIIKKSKVPLIVVLKTMTIGVVTVLLAGVIFPALSILTYVLGGILLVSMQSFLNALAFEYTNSGNKINFGFSRAGGSLGFAGTSFLLGQLLEEFSAALLPMIAIGQAVLFLIILLLLPAIKKPEMPVMLTEQRHSGAF